MRQRDKAILRAFAAMHVNLHAFTVDVAHLQAERFAHAQAERVDGPEVRSISRLSDGRHQSMHFADGQHIGQSLLLRNPQLLQHLPVAWHRERIEKLQSTVRDSQSSRSVLAFVDAVLSGDN